MTGARLSASDIADLLAGRIDQLAETLLPAGRREGREWRCGSIFGESGHSLGVHLAGNKSGIWRDFAVGTGGDALDLVAAVLRLDMADAIGWATGWLGIDDGEAARPRRPLSPVKAAEPDPNPDRWRRPWQAARPIAGTLAATYLAGRGLRFDDPHGTVLRFTPRHFRRSQEDQLEHHPALLALLRDISTGEPCGMINVYLRADGRDRIRDAKGKTSWGRAKGAVAMLSPFDEPTYGLIICEGVETGISLLMADLAPVWCCGGAGNLSVFPVISGFDALTVATDADEAGQTNAATVAARWQAAGREVCILAPSKNNDWADARKVRHE